MLLEKTYLKIRFLKFWENQLWILVFKDIIVLYLLMDRLVQGKLILSKDKIKPPMEMHKIMEQLIQIMIKEEFFQDSLNIYSMKLKE